MVKNVHNHFAQLKMMSYMFCPSKSLKSKNIQFTII